jgi:hypothetical protein
MKNKKLKMKKKVEKGKWSRNKPRRIKRILPISKKYRIIKLKEGFGK